MRLAEASRRKLDIENPVMEELRRFERAEGRSFGQAASELMVEVVLHDAGPPGKCRTSSSRITGCPVNNACYWKE